jgi:hypothetical protein
MAMQWCIDLRATQDRQEPLDVLAAVPDQIQALLDGLHEEGLPTVAVIMALELMQHDVEKALIEVGPELDAETLHNALADIPHSLT